MFLHVSVILFTGGGGVIPASIAGGIPACLAAGQVSGGLGGIPVCLAGFQADTQGEVEGSGHGVSRPTPGGVSRPTPGGSPGPHPGGYSGPHLGGG